MSFCEYPLSVEAFKWQSHQTTAMSNINQIESGTSIITYSLKHFFSRQGSFSHTHTLQSRLQLQNAQAYHVNMWI